MRTCFVFRFSLLSEIEQSSPIFTRIRDVTCGGDLCHPLRGWMLLPLIARHSVTRNLAVCIELRTGAVEHTMCSQRFFILSSRIQSARSPVYLDAMIDWICSSPHTRGTRLISIDTETALGPACVQTQGVQHVLLLGISSLRKAS